MASSPSAPPSVAAAAAATSKICFNPICKEPSSGVSRRKGWRLRSGELADLCDRCCWAYEQGSFCETFHSDAAGWRKCELCGKRVHCGCIVSLSCFVHLDTGGIECIVCARKALSTAPNQLWPPSLFLSSQVSERLKDHPVRSLSQMTNSFSGQWRQGTHLWNSGVQSDLQQRLSYEFDRPVHAEKLIAVRSSLSGQEKKNGELPERMTPSSLNHVARNGTATADPSLAYNMYQREQGSADGLLDFGHLGDNDSRSARKGFISDPCSTSSSGVNFESHPNAFAKSLSSSISKGDSTSLVGLAVSFSAPNGSNDSDRAAMTQSQQMPPPMFRQFPPNPTNMNDSAAEMHSGRSHIDARTRAQLLTRYWPKITDQELQQISGDSNSVITPLFEKILSASDAGRIGRLVLPKKCAEAYFPAISQPEGLPLKIQDTCGKEWVFQFRFWPNNNSRMYVLEGVTPCIQSMQLQAGDAVTFSRLGPEGKLVMGFRKASNALSEQEVQLVKSGKGPPAEGSKSPAELNANSPFQSQKASSETKNPANAEDQETRSKIDKTGFKRKDGSSTKSSQVPCKRKGSTLGSKSKRLRIENEDSIELKLTWEEAQGLLRPPPNDIPSAVVIGDHEIEEYKEAPVLGKPTIFVTDQAGNNIQWVQCEDCSKWRMLPIDALLPFRWTCSENKWDPERASCSCPQETSKELADVLPAKTGTRRTKKKVEDDGGSFQVPDGLDTLAKLAILGEGETPPASSQPTTTRHPRHRPGCTCIVCIQPPSGKGHKHKQSCTCKVCLTIRRRFCTLTMLREKGKSEKDAAAAAKNQSLPEMPPPGSDPLMPVASSSTSPQSSAVCHDGIALPSPLKTEIDLNIQPEREEGHSPVAHAGSLMGAFRDLAA